MGLGAIGSVLLATMDSKPYDERSYWAAILIVCLLLGYYYMKEEKETANKLKEDKKKLEGG